MITWRTWQLFYDSLPRHPLFWQDLDGSQSHTQQMGWRKQIRQAAVALLTSLFTIGFFWAIIPSFLILLYLMLFAGALVAGANAAVGISRLIAHEREQQRYDLVAVSPPGIFGISWALGTRFLRKNRRTVRLIRLIKGFHLICLVMVIGIVLLSQLLLGQTSGSGLIEGTVPQLLVGVIFVALMHVDFIQAVLMGALIGIGTNAYTSRRIDASLLASAVFLILKLVAYLGMLAGVGLVGTLLEKIGLADPLPLMMLSAFIFMFAIHEATLYWIWRIIGYELNFEPDILIMTKRYQL